MHESTDIISQTTESEEMGWSWGFQRFSLFMLLALITTRAAEGGSKSFNVNSFGAVGNGKTESSEAFVKAWNEACGWNGGGTVEVPRGTYFLNEVTFSGPCKGPVGFKLTGDLLASTYKPNSNALDFWLKFRRVDHLAIYGSGKLYGQGSSVWPYKKKCIHQPCSIPFPYTLRLELVNSGSVSDITSIDSKDKHISLFGCNDVKLSGVKAYAPGDSPNTDGIHLSHSRNIEIVESILSTGDDCIAIISATSNVNVSGVFCGPGHGISIGSMGGGPNQEPITGIHIRNCTFTNSTNGLQIKSWAKNPNYPALAADISFQDVYMNGAGNPIFLNQRYCLGQGCDPKAESLVQITDVKFINIWGTSSTKEAVDLQCSSIKPCQNILLEKIDLGYLNPETGREEPAVSSCSNVKGTSRHVKRPPPCI